MGRPARRTIGVVGIDSRRLVLWKATRQEHR